MDDKKRKVWMGLGFGSLVAGLYNLDPIKFSEFFNIAIQTEISRLLIAFSVAAWIHSGRVKKEFKNVTDAISGLGDALRADLSSLGSRIERVEIKVQGLEKKGE